MPAAEAASRRSVALRHRPSGRRPGAIGLALRSAALLLIIVIAVSCAVTLAVADDAGRSSPEVAGEFGSSPVIRSVTVEVRDIFDEKDLSTFYRTVNSLKVNTRENVIRRELLFKEGDRYDRFVLEESLRNLRSLPFIRNVEIVPRFEGDVVDVAVRVNDTWTLLPYLSYSSGGGTRKESIGLAETNLLGYGKRVEMLYANDEGRRKLEGVFDDNRLFGTFQELTVGYFNRSDGYRSVGYYGRPFRSLLETQSWNVDTDFYDLVGRLFEAGDERFIYREKREAVSAGYTFARGEPEEVVRRYTFGYDYSSSEFQTADADDFDDVNLDPSEVSSDPSLLAEDRRFSGPYFAFQRLEPDFFSSNFIDRFERVEDYNLGNDFVARTTFASNALGSDRDTILFNVADADGARLSDRAFVRGRLAVSGRASNQSVRNVVVEGDLRAYNIIGPVYWKDLYVGRHTLVGSINFDIGERLDKDREFLLGAGSGLRGYEDRTFTGDHRFLMNLEERVSVVEDLYRLISVGGAVFADAGGTSRAAFGDIFENEFHADVGIGLRFGFNRSSGGSVLRVDLAFPVTEGPDGSKAWEPRLLVTSGQAVNARLPNESQQSPGSNVTLKFIP